jgi:alcohol dehydrogenase class IV
MAYEFLGPRKIVAGENAISSVANEIKSLKGERCLIVTDPVIARTGLLGRLTSVLDNEKVSFGVFSEVEPDPGIETVESGRKVFAEGGFDTLVALGGGSSIDAAKVISFLATNEGTVKDYIGMASLKRETVPLIAIPTTAGTGSEVTHIAIVTDKEKKLKLNIRSPQLLPKTAVLDPALLELLPPDIIAYTGIDAFSHAVESFFSVRSNLLTQQLSLSAVRLIYSSLLPFQQNPKDSALASRMLHGSCIAGIAFTNGGLGAVHALAHPIGSHYHLSHGLTCALFLCQVLKENREMSPDKYASLLEAIEIPSKDLSAEEAGERFIGAVKEFMVKLGIPSGLKALGIEHEVQSMMIEDALKSPGLLANPAKFDRDKIVQLLESVG